MSPPILDLNEIPPLDLNEIPPLSPPNFHSPLPEIGETSTPVEIILEAEEDGERVSIPENIGSELQRHKKGNQLTISEKQKIIQKMLELSIAGRLQHGIMNHIAAEFNVSRQCLSRLWKKAKADLHMGKLINYQSKKKGLVGRKTKEIELSTLQEIPLRQRTNIRSLAHALECSKSSIHRLVQKGKIKPHSNAIKPALTAENKVRRLEFCISKIQLRSNESSHAYEGFFNVIHIDEKWFFISRIGQKYYLHPSEADPIRTCKSKRFITKVMFIAAIGRPQFTGEGDCIFDGKIGIWPFVITEPAKRSSKNRPAGELVTKPITSVTKDTIRDSLINKVIPAIKERWIPTADKKIFIQQDNARPHINPTDPEFLVAAKSDGFDIHLVCQPPNSPDLNCLDLGYFNAIQSLQHEKAPRNVDELVQAVLDSYSEMDPRKLNHVWLSYQATMTEIIKELGGNNFRLPHMGKGRLERLGQLPLNLRVESDLIEAAMKHIEEVTTTSSQITE